MNDFSPCSTCPHPGSCALSVAPCCRRLPVPSVPQPNVNPWHPMSDPVDLKTAGKALEELGECTAALARCLIQGMDGVKPDDGQVNRQWLENEMDDVRAQLVLLSERFSLTSNPARIHRKITEQRIWHKMA